MREQAGLTQPQLADLAGMNRFGIAKLEQGVTKPSWETVVALCKALRVTCDAFLQEPAPRPEVGPGRPAKPAPESDQPKRPRGRPRKDEGKGGPTAKGRKGVVKEK